MCIIAFFVNCKIVMVCWTITANEIILCSYTFMQLNSISGFYDGSFAFIV